MMRAQERLRVLHLIPSLFLGGGTERSLVEAAPHLRDLGVDVTVPRFFRRAPEGADVLRRAGIDVIDIEAETWPGRVIAMRRLLRECQADILQTSLFEADIVGRVAAVATGVPVVGSLVGTPYVAARRRATGIPRWKIECVRAVDALTARLVVDQFLANSSTVKDAAAASLGISPDKVTVVHRGRSSTRLGMESARPRARVRAALCLADADVLLTVGRLEAAKGHTHLLEAMPALLQRRPDLTLLIAGPPGAMSDQIEDDMTRLGLGSSVRLLGYRDDVPDLLAAADVFVFPSLFEGFPGAVIEAMAMGVPIAASAIAPVQELVDDECAVLFPPGDSPAIARKVGRLLEDRNLASRLAANAATRYELNFTVEREVESLARFYKRVARAHGIYWEPRRPRREVHVRAASRTRAEHELFTVIIPTYNRETLVARAIESVLAQTHANFEVIVVDDGSTDGTRRVLESIEDDRVRVVSQANAGPARARNAGLRGARGEVVTFLDSDDTAEPHWLESLAEPFEDADCGVVCCGVRWIDAPRDIDAVRLPGPDSWYPGDVLFLAGSFAVRRQLLAATGGYLDGLEYSDNTELGIRLIDAVVAAGVKIVPLYEPLATVNRETSGIRVGRRPEEIQRIINEHRDRFAADPARLATWLSIGGVDLAREGDLRRARGQFFRAWRARPRSVKNAARLLVSCVPPLARRTWPRPTT